MSCNLESYTWCTMQRSSSNFTDFNHTIFNLQPKYPFLQLLCIASFTTHDIINFLITEKLSICKLFEKSSDVFIQTYKYDRGFAMFGGCLKTWFVKYSLLMLVSKAETCLSVFSTSLHQLGSLQFGIGSLNLEYDFQKTRGSLPPFKLLHCPVTVFLLLTSSSKTQWSLALSWRTSLPYRNHSINRLVST